tara:strand:- start:3942 stop:4190 length:249 start_codon:yes stop_codon:yes gene_type:complete
MTISDSDYAEMEKALRKVALEKFGGNEFYIDKVQNRIANHLHWHARPKGWKPRLRHRILSTFLNVDSDLYKQIEKILSFFKK